MGKLKFEFVVKGSTDGKTNWLALTSITTTEKKTYAIPEQYQSVAQHTELMNTGAYKKVKTTLQKRHQTRKVWINLDEETEKTYIDEDGNLQFKEYLLEEETPEVQRVPATGSLTEETLTKILEQFLNKKAENDHKKNFKKLSEKFVLEKFASKSSSGTQWMELFEREFDRLGAQEDEEKIEILRLFLEGSCLD